ncbi:Inositol-1-monophosphatase [Chitinispirillum alkaliphilum]|nr:Inositol-1-monophosphatase [Chitinispirillum alkaliphilum]
MNDFMKTAQKAALEAGDFLFKHFESIKQVEKKADKSLVTNLDKESERMIIQRIKGDYPSHSILAEESGEQGGDDYLWVIDPLDGTHNFIRGINMYGVCIGLMYKGEFAAGVIYLPSYEELYTAERGAGAFKNDTPIKVSESSALEDATLLYDSGVHQEGKVKLGVLSEVSNKFFNIRMLGASCRNLTYLAEGKADALIEFDEKPWDFVAGASILLEAGGMMKGHNGEDVNVHTRQYVATNGLLDLEIRNSVKKALEKYSAGI